MIWTIYKMLFKLLPFINHIDAATFNQVCKYQSNQAFCTRTFATIRSGNAVVFILIKMIKEGELIDFTPFCCLLMHKNKERYLLTHN